MRGKIVDYKMSEEAKVMSSLLIEKFKMGEYFHTIRKLHTQYNLSYEDAIKTAFNSIL